MGDERGVRYLDQATTPFAEFMALFGDEDDAEAAPTDAFAALAPAPSGMLDVALADLKRILSGPSIQVRCLDCPVELRPTAAPERLGWKAMLIGLLS